MKLTWLWLLVYGLCAYRLTRLVAVDDIGAPIHEWLRRRAFHQSPTELRTINRSAAFTFKLISCAWCVSVWIGALVVLLVWCAGSWFQYVAAALALSSLAGVIHEALHGR